MAHLSADRRHHRHRAGRLRAGAAHTGRGRATALLRQLRAGDLSRGARHRLQRHVLVPAVSARAAYVSGVHDARGVRLSPDAAPSARLGRASRAAFGRLGELPLLADLRAVPEGDGCAGQQSELSGTAGRAGSAGRAPPAGRPRRLAVPAAAAARAGAGRAVCCPLLSAVRTTGPAAAGHPRLAPSGRPRPTETAQVRPAGRRADPGGAAPAPAAASDLQTHPPTANQRGGQTRVKEQGG